MGRGFPPALTSPPACRPPPLHKWRGGIDARHGGRYGFGEGGRDARHGGRYGFGEGELTPALRALWIWRGGIDARHVGRYGFGEGGRDARAAGVIGRGGVSLGRCGRYGLGEGGKRRPRCGRDWARWGEPGALRARRVSARRGGSGVLASQ